jgi:hypothetical protein
MLFNVLIEASIQNTMPYDADKIIEERITYVSGALKNLTRS